MAVILANNGTQMVLSHRGSIIVSNGQPVTSAQQTAFIRLSIHEVAKNVVDWFSPFLISYVRHCRRIRVHCRVIL